MKQMVLAFLLATSVTTAWCADSPELKDQKQKFSYSLGMSLGGNLKRSQIGPDRIDTETLVRGLRDAQGSGTTLLTETEAREAIRAVQAEIRDRLTQANKTEGEKFLAENKQKEGVVTLPSGLQYKVLTEGQGESPGPTDRVTVHYRGTLIDGTEFDSSHKRGKPATFAVNGVVKGWTEALQLMKPGAKWQLVIPSDLAYGPRGSGQKIGPNATLVFEIELISAQSAQPTAAARQPVTSDIIKVPSKEELEKGAKIEVIKQSEVDKYIAAEREKAKKAAEKKDDK